MILTVAATLVIRSGAAIRITPLSANLSRMSIYGWQRRDPLARLTGIAGARSPARMAASAPTHTPSGREYGPSRGVMTIWPRGRVVMGREVTHRVGYAIASEHVYATHADRPFSGNLNISPKPSIRSSIPARRRQLQNWAWFDVTTGLPAACSISSTTSSALIPLQERKMGLGLRPVNFQRKFLPVGRRHAAKLNPGREVQAWMSAISKPFVVNSSASTVLISSR